MENKNIIVIAVVIVVAVAAIAAGVIILNNNGNSDPVETDIQDMRGRTVQIPDKIDSVLALSSCSLELVSYFDTVNKVSALDSNDKLVAGKPYTLAYYDKFSKLPTVDAKNVEQIIKLNPTIIISSTVSVTDLDKLQSDTGIPVFAINADLEFGDSDWFNMITKLGKLFKEDKRAKEINDGIQKIISDIKSKTVKDINGYACGMMFFGAGDKLILRVSGDYLPFTYSGVVNVMPSSSTAPGKQPYDTDYETFASKDIDFMFIDNSSLDKAVAELEGYINDLGLDNDAIENGDVYNVLTYKLWGTQFDSVLINCLFVAKTVNGTAYDWNFEDKANEVLDLLYGGKLKLSDITAKQKAPGAIEL